MTAPIISSQISINKNYRRNRGLFTVNETLFTVTIYGEDGDFEEYEIEASSSREASHKALCLSSIIDVQYIDVVNF